jgi:hypothetical protein
MAAGCLKDSGLDDDHAGHDHVASTAGSSLSAAMTKLNPRIGAVMLYGPPS